MKLPSGPAGTIVSRNQGLIWETRSGRPFSLMSCELGVVRGRPCDSLRVC
jgi:hypothetical protein